MKTIIGINSEKLLHLCAQLNFFRKYSFYRFCCILLALHIFNVSVDMPDSHPDYISEDLSINDQESLVEMVVEQCFGIDDAIAEHDEADHHKGDVKLSKTIKICSGVQQQICFIQPDVFAGALMQPYHKSYIFQFVKEINPPPPKA